MLERDLIKIEHMISENPNNIELLKFIPDLIIYIRDLEEEIENLEEEIRDPQPFFKTLID